MTTDPKPIASPDRAVALRGIAGKTDPLLPEGKALPVPQRIEFSATWLTLVFGTVDEAAAWASKLDATSTRYREAMGTKFLLSNWTTRWRGWELLISAVELTADVPVDDVNVPADVLDVFAEDLELTDDDLDALLQDVPRGPAGGAR